MMRGLDILSIIIIALFAVSGAQLIVAPVPPKASGANEVVAFTMENPTSVALKSQYITFGHPFYNTQLRMVANTSILTAFLVGSPSTTFEVQVDAKALHKDGSVRQATLSLLQPAIPANSSITIMLTRTLRATAPIPISKLPASVVKVSLTFNESTGGSNFNYDVSQLVSAAGAKQNYWLQGELATQVRVSVWLKAAMRMVFDATMYKDDSWCVDVIYSNDVALTSTGGRQYYDTVITPLGLPAITYKDLANNQYTGFHKLVCSAGVSNVNVQYDQLNMIQSTSVFPLNYTIGLKVGAINDVKQRMADPSWGLPFATNGVTQYMPMSGDRPDLGALPHFMAVWFVSQNADAKKYMMSWGDTSHTVAWNYYNNITERYLNHWDYPNLWIDPRGNPRPTQFPEEDGWTPEGSHNPSLAVLPYVVSGSRYYLDLINAEAAWKVMEIWPAYRSNHISANYQPVDRAIVGIGPQIRAVAWTLRDIGWASYLGTPDSFHKTYFDSVVDYNLEFIVTNLTGRWSEMFGEIAGFYYISDDLTFSPWQNDHVNSAVSMIALQGRSRAADVMKFMKTFMVMAAFNHTGYSRNTRFAYHMRAGSNNVPCKTWKCLQDHNEVPKLNDLGGNYGQLGRQSLVLYQMVFPDDVDARAAREWYDASGVQYSSVDEFRSDPRTSVGNFPLAVPLNYTYTPAKVDEKSSAEADNSSADNSSASSTSAMASVIFFAIIVALL